MLPYISSQEITLRHAMILYTSTIWGRGETSAHKPRCVSACYLCISKDGFVSRSRLRLTQKIVEDRIIPTALFYSTTIQQLHLCFSDIHYLAYNTSQS